MGFTCLCNGVRFLRARLSYVVAVWPCLCRGTQQWGHRESAINFDERIQIRASQRQHGKAGSDLQPFVEGDGDPDKAEAPGPQSAPSTMHHLKRFARAIVNASALMPLQSKSIRRRRESLPLDDDFAAMQDAQAGEHRAGQGPQGEDLPSLEDIAADGEFWLGIVGFVITAVTQGSIRRNGVSGSLSVTPEFSWLGCVFGTQP